jgi:hypothetical protein
MAFPPDIKRDIATVVRSIEWVGAPGGTCFFRALTGLIALKMLEIPADIALGGMIYRAGPRRCDMVKSCGPDGLGTIGDRCLLAHYRLISGDDLVDFSVGDWKDTPGIEWTAPCPDFFWADRSRFVPGKSLTPDLGQAWYTGADQNLRDRDIGAMVRDFLRDYREVIIPAADRGFRILALKERLSTHMAPQSE